MIIILISIALGFLITIPIILLRKAGKSDLSLYLSFSLFLIIHAFIIFYGGYIADKIMILIGTIFGCITGIIMLVYFTEWSDSEDS